MTDYSNIQLELLASLINHPNQIHPVSDIIGDKRVFEGRNQVIYHAICSLFSSGEKVDVVSVGAKSGVDLIATMNLGTAFGATSYAKILVDRHTRKELRELGQYLTHASKDSDPFVLAEEASAKLFALESGMVQKPFLNSSQATEQAMVAINEGFQGVTTGFRDLDNILGGWRNSNLIILAGKPGEGKTACGITSAVRVAKSGVGVGIFSLEMATSELQIRILGAEARVDTFRLSIGKIDDAEYRRVEEARKTIDSLPIYFDDSSSISDFNIKSKARRLVREKNIGLIVVDYLQLVSGDRGGNREQEVSSISRTFKGMAKELQIPVLALAQMHRGSDMRGDKRPILSDLRESGALEQNADIVVFVYNKEELIVGKHRNGSIGDCPITFVKQYASFEDK